MNIEKHFIETGDIISDAVERVIAEDNGIIAALKERMEEGADSEKIKKAFASNFKFKIENKLMEMEGLDKNSPKESIMEFRDKYPLEEIEKKLYKKAEEFF